MGPTLQDGHRPTYLASAALLLQTSSPAVSAHLQLKSDELFPRDTSTPKGQHQSCVACGIMFVPGWSCKTLIGTQGKRTRKERIEKATHATKLTRLQCLRCNTVTLIEPSKSSESVTKMGKTRKQEVMPLNSGPQEDLPTPPEANSKEQAGVQSRKRSRGKKPTLQSLLSEQQAETPQTPAGFGLDLMDFMKS